MHAWMITANVMTESLICLKFGQGEFHEPAPVHVKIFWACLTSFLVLYAIWQFALPELFGKKKQKQQ
jgi:phosphatidylserine synthase 2